jgi:hypothetical protein
MSASLFHLPCDMQLKLRTWGCDDQSGLAKTLVGILQSTMPIMLEYRKRLCVSEREQEFCVARVCPERLPSLVGPVLGECPHEPVSPISKLLMYALDGVSRYQGGIGSKEEEGRWDKL